MQKQHNQIIKRIYILLPAQDSGLLKRETNKYQRSVKDLLPPGKAGTESVIFTTVSPASATALSKELVLSKPMLNE